MRRPACSVLLRLQQSLFGSICKDRSFARYTTVSGGSRDNGSQSIGGNEGGKAGGGNEGSQPGGNGVVQPGGNGVVQPGGNGVVQPGGNGVVQPGGNGVVQPGGNGVDQPGGNGVVQPGGNGVVQPGGNGVVQPGGKGVVQPGGNGVVQPGGNGVVQPGGNGVVQPGGNGVVQPGGNGVVQPGGKGVVQPGGKGVVQPGGNGVVQPGGKGVVQPDGKGVVQPGGKEVVQPGGNGVVQPGGNGVVQPGGNGVVQPGGNGVVQPGGNGVVQPGGNGVVQPGGNGSQSGGSNRGSSGHVRNVLMTADVHGRISAYVPGWDELRFDLYERRARLACGLATKLQVYEPTLRYRKRFVETDYSNAMTALSINMTGRIYAHLDKFCSELGVIEDLKIVFPRGDEFIRDRLCAKAVMWNVLKVELTDYKLKKWQEPYSFWINQLTYVKLVAALPLIVDAYNTVLEKEPSALEDTVLAKTILGLERRGEMAGKELSSRCLKEADDLFAAHLMRSLHNALAHQSWPFDYAKARRVFREF